MINEVRTYNRKISTAITATYKATPGTVSEEQQGKNLASWNKTIPRLLVMGPIRPPSLPGLRWLPSSNDLPLANLFGSYMMEIPGYEVCLVADPDFEIGGGVEKLLEFVDSQRMELAWGCYIPYSRGMAFLLNASVIAHIIQDLPATVHVGTSDWQKWLHGWLSRHMQPHRYFDGSRFGIISEPKPPVVNAYEIAPDVEPKTNANKRKKG